MIHLEMPHVAVAVVPVVKTGWSDPLQEPAQPPVGIGMHRTAPGDGDHRGEHGESIGTGINGLSQADQVHRHQGVERPEAIPKGWVGLQPQAVDVATMPKGLGSSPLLRPNNESAHAACRLSAGTSGKGSDCQAVAVGPAGKEPL